MNAGYALQTTSILPEGDLIGWKKCRNGRNDVIVKLRIPEGVKRLNGFGRECRAEYVEVLEVIGKQKIGASRYDKQTEYVEGGTMPAIPFDEDGTNAHSAGIHFFISREEAEAS
jgi:hypothetical protein